MSIVSISVSSTKPFSQHGIVLSLAIWAFVGSFSCIIYSLMGTTNTIANDHSVRVLGLFLLMMQSLGIATLMAAFITGVSASNEPFDGRVVA